MDTSKEYVKMCEKAVEIQELWEPKEGDFVYGSDGISVLKGRWFYKNLSLFTEIYGDNVCDFEKSDCVWLPRQDQLQDIIGDFDECLRQIDRWGCMSSIGFDYQYTTSMEQLWIGIVMKEKYNKVWNGNDWAKC